MKKIEVQREFNKLVKFLLEKMPMNNLMGVQLEGGKYMIFFSAN